MANNQQLRFCSSGRPVKPFSNFDSDDRFIPGLMMVEAVHSDNGKIVCQLVHGGKFALQDLTGRLPMGPSAEEVDGRTVCGAMSIGDISSVAQAFGRAAFRARQAAFDAVQNMQLMAISGIQPAI